MCLQQKSVTYAADERLTATVAATRHAPALDVRVARALPAVVYAGQVLTLQLALTNVGEAAIEGEREREREREREGGGEMVSHEFDLRRTHEI